MDVLLSLPIVSYFLGPTVTSWSTSLNLLFFYMTWTTLVLSHGPLRIELIGVFAMRVVLWLIPSLLFLVFDTLLPSLAENVKFRGAAALPPRNAARIAKLLALALLNLALETGAEAGVSIGLTRLSKGKRAVFKTSTALPLPWQIIKHIASLMVAREVLTYYIHRFLLAPGARSRVSRRVSRWHNETYGHARRAPPFSLLVFADHPVPFLLQRFLPMYLPAIAIRPHLLTYFMFVGMVTVEETLAMSGYSIVPGIIMGAIAKRTSMHYIHGNGNFGAWGFLDWIHGTSVGKNVTTDVKDEAEKHRVKERGEETADRGTNFIQDSVDSFKKGRTKSRRSRKANSDD